MPRPRRWASIPACAPSARSVVLVREGRCHVCNCPQVCKCPQPFWFPRKMGLKTVKRSLPDICRACFAFVKHRLMLPSLLGLGILQTRRERWFVRLPFGGGEGLDVIAGVLRSGFLSSHSNMAYTDCILYIYTYMYIYIYIYLLGLRPLAGYASLKLYYVMSFFFPPTAESFGVSAQIGSGVVRGGPEVRFHESSTRVPTGFHQGSTRVPRDSARAAGWCEHYIKRAPHAVGDIT